MPYCYQSIRLTYIGAVAGITFQLVYSTGVGVLGFLWELPVYCVGGTECYLQISMFEKISDLMYGRAALHEGDPFPITVLFCLCRGCTVFFGF